MTDILTLSLCTADGWYANRSTIVICAVSLTACILFHGTCMTSVGGTGPCSLWNLRAPPFVPGAGPLAGKAPKEEQARHIALHLRPANNQPSLPRVPPPRRQPVSLRCICAICSICAARDLLCLDRPTARNISTNTPHYFVADQQWNCYDTTAQGSGLSKFRVLQRPGAIRLIGGLSISTGRPLLRDPFSGKLLCSWFAAF